LTGASVVKRLNKVLVFVGRILAGKNDKLKHKTTKGPSYDSFVKCLFLFYFFLGETSLLHIDCLSVVDRDRDPLSPSSLPDQKIDSFLFFLLRFLLYSRLAFKTFLKKNLSLSKKKKKKIERENFGNLSSVLYNFDVVVTDAEAK
jgi:hypothetical protein